MNIFVLDKIPEAAAQYHCDKHVVKMILESAQMLCTVANELGLTTPYKTTHKNHPCTKWARESKANYRWLLDLFIALHYEWQYRYNHKTNHKSFDKLLVGLDYQLVLDSLPDLGLTPFAQAMPDNYKDIDAVKAYRAYYLGDKADLLYYTKRNKPNWMEA